MGKKSRLAVPLFCGLSFWLARPALAQSRYDVTFPAIHYKVLSSDDEPIENAVIDEQISYYFFGLGGFPVLYPGWHENWVERYSATDAQGELTTASYPVQGWGPPDRKPIWMHVHQGSVLIPECYGANSWDEAAGTPVTEASADCSLNIDENSLSSIPDTVVCKSSYTKAQIERGIERAKAYCKTGAYPPN